MTLPSLRIIVGRRTQSVNAPSRFCANTVETYWYVWTGLPATSTRPYPIPFPFLSHGHPSKLRDVAATVPAATVGVVLPSQLTVLARTGGRMVLQSETARRTDRPASMPASAL